MKTREPLPDDSSVDIRLGREELVISGRYELASIANDILLGLWFVVGSVLFFSESTLTIGTWLFLIGSVQMLIRPVIRLARRTHLRRISTLGPESPMAY
ncbi:YrhK family protein [Gordonia zhaorongruii]|uniref:YrhK family protein n=1 Tax=Gordonia zhaorongruii TaxID=2597659 RepID=UPI0010464C6B|nr:YrhK family protein [Gordonia zhaorongruii]